MAKAEGIDMEHDAHRLKVDTLVRLRWLAVIGQSAAVAGVQFGLDYALPFGACFGVIACSALLNIILRIRYPASARLDPWLASLILGYDVLQLSVLLFLTGGLQNPFSLLVLAPVMISATVLPPWRTLLLGAFALALTTGLAFFHLPLPWVSGETLSLPLPYIIGIWFAIQLGLGFTGVYTWRVADEARQLAHALSATELVLEREQHLWQLDGLAAAAAHELGTPLATIALVVRELDRAAGPDHPMAEDLALLREQVGRCREILATLTSLGTNDAGPLGHLTLSHLIEEVAGPQRGFEVPITITCKGEGREPVTARNPGLLYGLGNIVDNAVDFARRQVTIEAHWTADTVTLAVRDDGPGFTPDILLRLGEPYVTSRGAERRGIVRRSHDDNADGHGLGVFIAKTLIERSGAEVTWTNAPGEGALVQVVWPRQVFEAE
ncbi:two-component system sensor histidine kinase RegB [Pseudochelatococcus lubricantis]|uniref:histidine kinase n=1 Tax=Pseudochelatococcus lubricantis TaxID=1538102 RepID=A0ABX0UW24_9HYPH|nr:ActS/PrrB/RegB family redox-sensitive histidine kinase [Pseudochelatococcus lubricantis]NIJ57154.1 two-component system sensor histidine kinase RegB [Pseudochelatococcus lubricantis]